MPTVEELAAQKAAEEAAKKAAEDAAKKTADDQIAQIMKDPEAIKALLEAKRAANAEAKELRLKQEAADKVKKDQEEAALKEQNKFKELAEKKEGELTAAKSAFNKRLIDTHLKIEALAAGALDEDAVIALAGRTDIKVGENFEVTGVKEAVEALKKGKPHLFGKPDDKKVAPPRTGVPAPRGGFSTEIDVTKMSARELMAKGLEQKK